MRVLVVTPYINESQGNELELSIIGWKKYFQEDFRRVVIGDYCDCLKRYPDVEYIKAHRVGGIAGMYRPHLDMANKWAMICEKFGGEYEGFVRVADDCYPVNSFNIDDIKKLKYQSKEIEGSACAPSSFWKHDKWRTRQTLLKEGLPCRNFTIHSPMWYDIEKLRALINKYDLTHNSYVIEDLYFNTYHSYEDAVLLDYQTENYRGMINSQGDVKERFENLSKKKMWIFNTKGGWSRQLGALIKDYYNKN